MKSWSVGWLLLLLFAATACDERKGAPSWAEEVAQIEQLAFPASEAPDIFGVELMKWSDRIDFVVITDQEPDSLVAAKTLEAIAADLPSHVRAEISLTASPMPDGEDWYKRKAIIFVGSEPYTVLRNELFDVFRYLSIDKANIDREIQALEDSGAPVQNKILISRTGEVMGFLAVLDSNLSEEEKKLRLAASITFALSPSLLALRSDPGLYEWKDQDVGLSPLGEDYFSLLYNEDVKAGMNREEFARIVRQTL